LKVKYMDGFLDNLPVDDDLGFGRQRKKKIEKDNVIYYYIMKCPKCGSEKITVVTTRRPLRYHKCDDCGHTFKSVEK